MALGSRLTLNARVSLFRHNGGVYLFDPASRTYASMNEAMLALVTNPDGVNSLERLSGEDRKGLGDVAAQLRGLGILVEPEAAGTGDWPVAPESASSVTHLAIFVTTKCNLRCAYCYARGGDTERTITSRVWQLAMDHFFSTLESAAALRRASRQRVDLAIHGGGEATVEFSTLQAIVMEFCGRARAAGLRPSVSMGTNGTYDDSVHRWIVENKIGVNISLDGPPEIQNRLRPLRSGQPSYEAVARNIQLLVASGRPVSVRATVTNEALPYMQETIALAGQLGIAKVHFEPVSLTGRCATTALERPDAEQFAEEFLKCFLLGLRYDVEVGYSGLRCFEHRHPRFCAACGQNFCVTPDGNITTCYEVLDSRDPAAREFFIGRVDPVQGRVVLDQTRIEQLKLRVAENMEACQDCFLRYHCAGDCPVKSFRHSQRDLYSPDPYRCEIADRINKQLIAWLASGIIEPRDVEQTRVISFNQS